MRESRSLVLKLAQLELEYSADELHRAMNFLDGIGGARGFFRAAERERIGKVVVPKKSVSRPSKGASQDRFSDLRNSDERKYVLIKELEHLLLSGAVLSQFDDLRKFGAAVSKRFLPRKSRKDSIYPLLALVVEMPAEQVERLIDIAKKESSVEGDSSYQGLAEFIIGGRKSV